MNRIVRLGYETAINWPQTQRLKQYVPEASPKVVVTPLRDLERRAIIEALKVSNWLMVDAAGLLEISPSKIGRKIRRLGIELPANCKKIHRQMRRAGGRPRKT